MIETTPIHWRDRPLLRMKLAAEIACVSVASLYRQEKLGNLKFRQLAGRTLIDTESFIQFLDGAKAWSPQPRTNAATAARVARAKAE
jgi:hypothetical protein